jgi:hypothetical protein
LKRIDEPKIILEGGWGGGADSGFAAARVRGECEFSAAAAF